MHFSKQAQQWALKRKQPLMKPFLEKEQNQFLLPIVVFVHYLELLRDVKFVLSIN